MLLKNAVGAAQSTRSAATSRLAFDDDGELRGVELREEAFPLRVVLPSAPGCGDVIAVGVTLEAEVAFHVDRGHFPIQGMITFEEGSVPEISIECG